MFSNGFKLAENRGLTRGGVELTAARATFAREMRDIARSLRLIGEMAAARRAEALDDGPK